MDTKLSLTPNHHTVSDNALRDIVQLMIKNNISEIQMVEVVREKPSGLKKVSVKGSMEGIEVSIERAVDSRTTWAVTYYR